MKYRVPGLLATSASDLVAYNFYYAAYDRGLPAVLFRVQLDPRGETDPRYGTRPLQFESNIFLKKFSNQATAKIHRE